MFNFLKKEKLKKEISKQIHFDPHLLDMEQVVTSAIDFNLADNGDLFDIYKEILWITSKKTVPLTQYYAKGLPLWAADVPSEYKNLYFHIVKQSILKIASNINLIAETLPSMLLQVDERYRKSYLDTLLLCANQKMSTEQKMAEVISRNLTKIDDSIVNEYFQLIQTSIIQDPTLGLKITREFTIWIERVPQENLSLFLTCIVATTLIDPAVGRHEAEILSSFMCKWSDDKVKTYHKIIIDAAGKFTHVGKTIAEYLPQLVEDVNPAKVESFKKIMSDVLQCNSYLGQSVAMHLPGLLIYDDDSAHNYKLIILSIAAENLNTGISAAGSLPSLFYLKDSRLVELYVDIVMDVIRQSENTRCFQAKMLAEKLPKWTIGVIKRRRFDYLKLIHKIALCDNTLIRPAGSILPDLFRMLSLKHVEQFVEQGMDILNQDHDKAIAFFSLTTKTAQEKVAQLKSGVPLKEIAHTLRLYATAHGGRELHIKASNNQGRSSSNIALKKSYTDGKTIYLPDEIDKYPDKLLNFKFYKLITAVEASKIEFGTYNFNIKKFSVKYKPLLTREFLFSLNRQSDQDVADLDRFFNCFSLPALALDLFKIFEFGRVTHLLFKTYKGLNRTMQPFLLDIFHERPSIKGLIPVEAIIELLLQLVYWGKTRQYPVNKNIQQIVRIIYKKYMDALNQKNCDVYYSSYLTFEAFNIIMDCFKVQGYDATEDVFEEIEDEDFKYSPNTIMQEGDSVTDDVDTSLLPDEDDPGQKSENVQDNVIQNFDPDSKKEEPHGLEEEALDNIDFQDYNPFEDLPFQGDLRADLVQEKHIELMQALNTLKKEIDDTDDEALKKEINDMLEQKEISGPTFDTEEILPLVKGKNFDRLLTGFREKDIRVKDLLEERFPGNADETVITGDNIYYYDEWDTIIRDYKPKWVTVHEKIPDESDPEIVTDILNNNANTIGAVKRQFERLNLTGMKKLKRQFDGDDLDIDAVTEAIIDIRIKSIPSDKLYIKREQRERNVSVVFLVDLSNSTSKKIDSNGKTVLDVEREGLIIMAEALESIGDDYAIYGFSGRGRHHCTFYVFKDFFQPYNDVTKNLIGGMIPLTSTRLGPALRHSILKLNNQDSKSKLLFLLTDGKPVDNDNYDDQYAWDDTKTALREVRNANIHPYCITIDDESRNFHDNVYGDVNYTIIKDVTSLPARLPTIYHKITRP